MSRNLVPTLAYKLGSGNEWWMGTVLCAKLDGTQRQVAKLEGVADGFTMTLPESDAGCDGRGALRGCFWQEGLQTRFMIQERPRRGILHKLGSAGLFDLPSRFQSRCFFGGH